MLLRANDFVAHAYVYVNGWNSMLEAMEKLLVSQFGEAFLLQQQIFVD